MSVQSQDVPSMGNVTPIEKRMLSLLGPNKSPWEVSEELNGVLTPEEVFQRSQEILHERNWLSTLQLKLLMVDRAWKILDRFAEFANDGSTASAKIALGAIKELRVLLDEDTERITDAMKTISSHQAEQMASAIQRGFDMVLTRLDVDREKADELILEAIPVAMREIDATNREE